jgi:hypothetical protein
MTDAPKLEVVPANSPSIGSTQACTIEMVHRHLRMHSISAAELDSIASGSSSVNLTFFGVCFGAAISFGIGLYSGGINQAQIATYKGLFFASSVLTVFFGVQAIRSYRDVKRKVRDLKSGSSQSSN